MVLANNPKRHNNGIHPSRLLAGGESSSGVFSLTLAVACALTADTVAKAGTDPALCIVVTDATARLDTVARGADEAGGVGKSHFATMGIYFDVVAVLLIRTAVADTAFGFVTVVTDTTLTVATIFDDATGLFHAILRTAHDALPMLRWSPSDSAIAS
jgi:uncharacterized protein with GYD domain